MGRLLLNKNYNMDGMKVVFTKAWRLKSTLTILALGDQRFLFMFDDPNLEKDRALVKKPWSFNKSLLILQEFDGL